MKFISRTIEFFRKASGPRVVVPARARLGENPVWSAAEQALYWIDIPAGRLHRHLPGGGDHAWQVGAEVHALALDAAGGRLLAIDDRLLRFDVASQSLTEVQRFADWNPACRFNDCICDRAGRLWIGSMDRKGDRPLGRLYRISAGAGAEVMLDGFTICNGPAFSLTDGQLYIADSPRRVVYRTRLGSDGTPGEMQPFTRFGADEGYPDGMAIDAQDHLWIAHYDGGRVSRFDPRGVRVAAIRFPVARVTACTFGGPDLKTLFVTTASAGLSAKELRDQPEAGGLYAVAMDVAGVPANPCGL